MIVTTSPSGVANSTSATANTTTYLNLTDGTNGSAATVKTSVKFTGTGATTISGSGASTAGGQTYININSTDQKVSSSNSTAKLFLIGTEQQSTAGQAGYSNVHVYQQAEKLFANGGLSHDDGSLLLIGNGNNAGKVSFVEDIRMNGASNNQWNTSGDLYVHGRNIYTDQYPEIIDLV
jgi:hypothetical protein